MGNKYINDWSGCGECDSSFRCWGGETRCIRLQPSNVIPYPLKAHVGKYDWFPYTIQYSSPEGPFQAHIYAINDYHAQLQLEALKDTGRLIGKVVGVK